MTAAGANDEEDVLWLAPSCEYPLTETLIAFDDQGFPVTIQGRGATISGEDQRRGFIVLPGAALHLEDVTVRDGFAFFDAGGAIFNAGTLTLTRSTVSESEATVGGGIFNRENAELTLLESTVSGNTASLVGGGIGNENGRLTLIGSTVSANTAPRLGGGIYNAISASAARAMATLVNCTVSGNASQFGAGVFNDEGVLVVSHCTLSDNTIVGSGTGGGIYHRNLTAGAGLKLDDSIVANSIAESGSASDCLLVANVPLGLNLIGDGSCGASISGDPRLGSPTGNPAHHPLLPGSPAIDAALNFNCPGVDQRGARRPEDGNEDTTELCDLGSYEAAP
jgi:hypothetical protein